TCGRLCVPGWLTIIKDAHTPAWALGSLKHLSLDPCQIPNCTGTGCHLIVRSERKTFCMGFITNTHGKTVPHDAGRGFCGAHDQILEFRKQRLYFLPLPLCPGECWCVRQVPGALARGFMHVNGEILISP